MSLPTVTPACPALQSSLSYDTSSIETASDTLFTMQRARQVALKSSLRGPDTLYQMQQYLARLQLDISTMNFCHVAGSKGKGSSSTYLENALYHAGFSTGLYTSPNLVAVSERFRINTKTVPDSDFLNAMWAVWDKIVSTVESVPIVDVLTGASQHNKTIAVSSISSSPQPQTITNPPSNTNTSSGEIIAASTGPDNSGNVAEYRFEYPPYPAYFQFLTLVAFYLYKQHQIDVIVMEVGLGGRVDATNIINPLATAITTLSLEHTEILGTTLDKIAFSKTGIFKPNCPIVVFPQHPEAWNVILSEAKKVNSIPIAISTTSQYRGVNLGISGEFQPQNANLALMTAAIVIKALYKKGVVPSNYENHPNGISLASYQSLVEMQQCVKDEFASDRENNSFQQPTLELSLSDPVTDSACGCGSGSGSGNNNTKKASKSSFSTDVSLLKTLRTFDTLITHRDLGLDQSDNDNDNDESVDGDQAVLNSDQSDSKINLRYPQIDPSLRFQDWVDAFSHDQEVYYDIIAKFNLNNPVGEKVGEVIAPGPLVTLLKEINANKLKMCEIRLNNQLNYLSLHPLLLTPTLIRSLCTTRLRGRCDTIYNTFTLPLGLNSPEQSPANPNLNSRYAKSLLWYIDGAHTTESIAACIKWYSEKCRNEPISTTIARERAFLLKSSSPSSLPPHSPLPGHSDHKLGNSQLKMLVFNCGHIRSPFTLLKPIIDEVYSNSVFKSIPKQSQNLPFFEHIFFCPFDMDKPTDIALPSLLNLFQQHDIENGTNNAQKLNFNPITETIQNGTYSINSSHPSDNTSKVETKSLLPFRWQFQTMSVMDFMICSQLGQSPFSSGNQFDQAVLFTLQSSSHSTKSAPSLNPLECSSNATYHKSRYNLGSNEQELSPVLEGISHPIRKDDILPFSPPLATLVRVLPPLCAAGDSLMPPKMIHFHIMPTSRDATMAVQYFAAQHSDFQCSENSGKSSDSTSRVLVVGSLYLAGNVLKALQCKI